MRTSVAVHVGTPDDAPGCSASMALPGLSFILALVVLSYLSSFVLFALLRIITGVSIQRIGWSGLRRIAFTPHEGIKINIRGLGLSLHRPTFAQPTWISVVLTDLCITIDPTILGSHTFSSRSQGSQKGASGQEENDDSRPSRPRVESSRSRTWQRLTEIKERIKGIHRKIRWIRMVDVVATNSRIVVLEVGSVQIATVTVAVDTRRKTADRSRLFRHRKTKSNNPHPAEWIFTLRSALFTPEGGDSTELLDHCTLNIHGILHENLDGLRDASISLKLGRLNIPYDDLLESGTCLKRLLDLHRSAAPIPNGKASLTDVFEELQHPGSREDAIVQAVSDSKEFFSSLLKGVQEVQFAFGFLGLSKRLRFVQSSGCPVYLHMSMKEVGLDLQRLDPRSPAHRMYFPPSDIAHQALIAAISISVGIDDGHDHPEKLLYIPMATATMKTTLPAKTIQTSGEKNVAERNANILFANLVITSPSMDLDPNLLPLLLALTHTREKPVAGLAHKHTKPHLISRLLPKASVKISVHEPVVRISLPSVGADSPNSDDFDLLISSMSSMTLDIESFHSAGGEVHYALGANLRVTSHELYYQTGARERHNLLLTDTFEVKTQVTAAPDFAVAVTGNLHTFSVFMIRDEISDGLRQIFAQLQSDLGHHPTRRKRRPRESFLRRLPQWLHHVKLQGSDFNIEIAGLDEKVSPQARGCAFQLGSWTAEYRAHKAEANESPRVRRRVSSKYPTQDGSPTHQSPPQQTRHRRNSASDGRRLAIHLQTLEGFIIDTPDAPHPEPFLSLPRFEVAFTTSTDNQGPILHVNSFAKSLYLEYSLLRHYSVCVALILLRKTFTANSRSSSSPSTPSPSSRSLSFENMSEDFDNADFGSPPLFKPEITTVDFKATMVQIKAFMPADPPLLLQVSGLEAGSHRWAPPFAKARLARLYTDTPAIKTAWSRVVSIKGVRVDYRHSRRKYGLSLTEDKSIDFTTEATRIAVPHQLIVHKVFDNVANVVKTVQQLHHRLKDDSDDDVVEKRPEQPRRVPKLSIRCPAFLFEIEDGAFEWKLGVIYRLGLLEQKQRLAREEAFHLKARKLRETQNRAERANRRSRSEQAELESSGAREKANGRLADAKEPRGRSLEPAQGVRKMRFDTDGLSVLSGDAEVKADHAWEKLQHLNAQSWKKRIDLGLKHQSRAMKDIRAMFWGVDELLGDSEQKENILAIPLRPGLMALLISDLHILIDKPSFPLNHYSRFLHRVGKGMPVDMEYALLIPMGVQVSMGEVKMTLRDYPLPVFHVPAIKPGQAPRLPSLSLKTDFVIAEEYQSSESSRPVNIIVVPAKKLDSGETIKGLKIEVRRTISPVKTYSDISVDINTGYATKITWGTSYQPAIQDMMQVIEGFTKPPVDPSERVGFWDKIRLLFHSRIKVSWKCDGDVHLALKGMLSPQPDI